MMLYRQNKSPFAIALGDWFPLSTYLLTSKASPNDTGIIVIVVVIIVGEAKLILHSDGIIAQIPSTTINFEARIYPDRLWGLFHCGYASKNYVER